jgi:hypothetical protein
MARIEDIERRLLNWARWHASMSSGSGQFARCDMTQERVDGGGYDTPTPIPLNDAEATETERAVCSLDADLQGALRAVYLDGGPMRRKVQRLGVSEATVYARVELAHRRISAWLTDQTQISRQHRARAEALQAAARP